MFVATGPVFVTTSGAAGMGAVSGWSVSMGLLWVCNRRPRKMPIPMPTSEAETS